MVSTLCAPVKKKMRKAEIIVKVVFCFIAHFRTASINFGSVCQSVAQNVHLHAVTVPWFAEKQKAMIKKFRITWGKTRLRERDGRRFRKWHNTKKEKKNGERRERRKDFCGSNIIRLHTCQHG